MSLLHLHPRAAHVEDALAAELGAGPGAVVLGRDHVSLRQLIERAWASEARPVRIGPLGERLLVDAVADEAAGAASELKPLAGMRGFAESLARVIAAWQLAGIAPGEVAALGRRAGPSSGRIAALATLYARYAERLGERVDEAGVTRLALATLRQRGRALPWLAEVEGVVAHHASIDPRMLDVIEALAESGIPVALELPLVAAPGQPRPLLERALEPLARRIEERADLPIELRHLADAPPGATEEAADDSPRALLLGQLFRPAADPRRRLVPDAPVDLCAAPSPDAEARAAARRVRDLLSAGVAPQSIAVVARDPSQRDRLARWLLRYRVPLGEPGRAATTSVPVRLALRLAELADDDVPREALIALVSSRYVAGWIDAEGDLRAIPPHRIARLLREAGVRDAAPEEGVPGYRRRLGELARATKEGPRRIEVERVAARVEEWLALLLGLPARGTVAEQARALDRAILRLGIPLTARGYVTRKEAGLDDVAQVAHDQAAVAALSRALADLPRAAVRAGLTRVPIERARFARLVESILAADQVRPGGARGGTVLLAAPDQIAGRRGFAHVIACGLGDGVLPARSAEDALLSDEDRRRFNALAARPTDVLPRAATTDEREPLRFLELCAAPSQRLHLFYAAADSAGRPTLRSPYLDEIERATGRPAIALPIDPIPLAADCRTPAELRARAALECDAPAAGRLSPRDPDASFALARAVAAVEPGALDGARAVAAIERRRLAFFDGAAPADRYSGRIADPALLEALGAALPGSEEKPLSASAIEDYARCGFRFFAGRLLHVAPPDESGDELDALAGGRLHHRVLERLFTGLLANGELPLTGHPQELRRLEETLGAVLAEWEQGEQRGHPSLFAVRGQRVARELRALVQAEGEQRFFAPHVPSHFEHPFRATITPPPGGAPLHLRGAIDRIDVGPAGAVVIDYKTGRSSTYRGRLTAEALLVTSFQLPLYAAAARAVLGVATVAACYLAIRDARHTALLSDAALLSLDARAAIEGEGPAPSVEPRAPANVGEAVWLLHRDMRRGEFTVAPRTCEFCSLSAACRVVVRRHVDEGTP